MIDGNTKAELQLKSDTEKNEIGEAVPVFTTVHTVHGCLDLQGGESRYSTYSTKMQESTHLFICDYFKMDSRICAENSRIVINDKHYDIMLIDDPMELHDHWEIYLKLTGEQNG